MCRLCGASAWPRKSSYPARDFSRGSPDTRGYFTGIPGTYSEAPAGYPRGFGITCGRYCKYLNGMLPPSTCMLGMFILDCNLHNYNTRASANLHFHLPRHRTSAFQHTIKFSGPSIWNNLPLSLRNSASLSIFKHKLFEL